MEREREIKKDGHSEVHSGHTAPPIDSAAPLYSVVLFVTIGGYFVCTALRAGVSGVSGVSGVCEGAVQLYSSSLWYGRRGSLPHTGAVNVICVSEDGCGLP